MVTRQTDDQTLVLRSIKLPNPKRNSIRALKSHPTIDKSHGQSREPTSEELKAKWSENPHTIDLAYGEGADCRLGRYRLLEVVGTGTCAVVHKAWDPALKRLVAIKVFPLPFHAHDSTILARFRREAQIIGRLHHPNIVSAFDYGEVSDSAFIVMEYAAGRSLAELLRDGIPLPVNETIFILHDILMGLDHSHAKGIVHRDLKPANLLLTAENRIKISDFGISHLLDVSATMPGAMLGTPAYMAPEQITGKELGPYTDLYSVGVIIYKLLTGCLPFEGTIEDVFRSKLHGPVPAPSSLNPLVTSKMDAVVAKALARDPGHRFINALDMLATLEEVLGFASGLPFECSSHRHAEKIERRLVPGMPLRAERPSKMRLPLICGFVSLGLLLTSDSSMSSVMSVIAQSPILNNLSEVPDTSDSAPGQVGQDHEIYFDPWSAYPLAASLSILSDIATTARMRPDINLQIISYASSNSASSTSVTLARARGQEVSDLLISKGVGSVRIWRRLIEQDQRSPGGQTRDGVIVRFFEHRIVER